MQLDVPHSTYRPNPIKADGTPSYLTVGTDEPFDAETLLTLYGDKSRYLEQFNRRLDTLIRDGWLLADDADEESARGRARRLLTRMDVDELLGTMTLEEKCAQLGGVWFSDLLVDGELDDARMAQALSLGIGHITRIAGTGFDPVRAAEAHDRIQRFLEERTRLAIPALAHEEALSGLMGPRRDHVSTGDRPGGNVGSRFGRTGCDRRGTAGPRHRPRLRSRRCSTSPGIRAGAASKRRTERIPNWRAGWASPSYAVCKPRVCTAVASTSSGTEPPWAA